MEPVTLALAIAQAVPSLLKLFGAKDSVSSAAEDIVGIATKVTGKSSPEEILTEIQSSTRVKAEIEQAAKELEFRYFETSVADKANARARDIAYIQAGTRNIRADVLAYSATGAFLLLLFALIFAPVDNTNTIQLLYYLLGALTVIVRDVFSFEFGISKDSSGQNSQSRPPAAS